MGTSLIPATCPTDSQWQCIIANDDAPCSGVASTQSVVTFTPVPGTVYYVIVQGFSALSGAFTLSWAAVPLPSPTPSRTASPTASLSRGATPSPSPSPGTIPATWDPLLDPRYGVCYDPATLPILDQGACGSCYAVAAVTQISIALCRTAIDAGLRAPMGLPKQLSAMEAMNWQDDYWRFVFGVTDPAAAGVGSCNGGWPSEILEWMRYIKPSFGTSVLLQTCNFTGTGNGVLGKSCYAGCDPYIAGACPGPAGGVVNPIAGGGVCPAWATSQNSCPNIPGGAADADSTWLTRSASAWIPVGSWADPKFVGAFTTTGQDSMLRDVANQNSVLHNVDPTMPATGWSDADIAAVKKYLLTRGPMTILLAACSAWMSQSADTCGVIGGVQTIDLASISGGQAFG